MIAMEFPMVCSNVDHLDFVTGEAAAELIQQYQCASSEGYIVCFSCSDTYPNSTAFVRSDEFRIGLGQEP